MKKNIRYAVQDLDDILTALNINESNGFSNQLKRLHRQNIGNPDAEEHDFKCFVVHSSRLGEKLNINSNHYHITTSC